jgi:hypothetical protein
MAEGVETTEQQDYGRHWAATSRRSEYPSSHPVPADVALGLITGPSLAEPALQLTPADGEGDADVTPR